MLLDKKIIIWILRIFFCLIILSIFLPLPKDPDMGFHLRTGERILKEGLPFNEVWFNYSYADYNWIPFEWLNDILVWTSYSWLGLFGIVLFYGFIFSLFILVLVYLLKEKKQLLPIHLISASLALIGIASFNYARPQIFSWLFYAVVLSGYVKIIKNQFWPISWWFIIYLIWANLHNSYLLGIGVGIIIALNHCIVTKIEGISFPKQYWFKIFVTSLIATFINPYTFHSHYEAIFHFFASDKLFINEWQPPTIHAPLGAYFFIISLVIFSLFSLFKLKIENVIYFILFILTFVLGLSSLRHLPIFYITIIPILGQLLTQLIREEDIKLIIQGRKFKIISFSVAGILFLTGLLNSSVIYQSVTDKKYFANLNNYPFEATKYLKAKGLPSGNMFNSYNWGGWLIWNFPETDWYIDGRMPLWRNQNSQLTAINEYFTIKDIQPGYESTLDKRNVRWIFIEKDFPLAQLIHESNQWQIIYQDQQVIIAQKKN